MLFTMVYQLFMCLSRYYLYCELKQLFIIYICLLMIVTFVEAIEDKLRQINFVNLEMDILILMLYFVTHYSFI